MTFSIEEKKRRRAACKDKYQASERFKAIRAAYVASGGQKAAQRRYQATEGGKEAQARHMAAYYLKLGLGVYVAKFPSGLYIGQGQLQQRKNDHLAGNGAVARKLGEKATSFVIWFKGTKQWCEEYEQHVIDWHINSGIEIVNTTK